MDKPTTVDLFPKSYTNNSTFYKELFGIFANYWFTQLISTGSLKFSILVELKASQLPLLTSSISFLSYSIKFALILSTFKNSWPITSWLISILEKSSILEKFSILKFLSILRPNSNSLLYAVELRFFGFNPFAIQSKKCSSLDSSVDVLWSLYIGWI